MGRFAGIRSRLIILLCIGIAAYFLYTAGTSALRGNQLERERSESAQQVEELAETKAYLEAVKNYVASDEYVEQEARRQLGYTRDGEIPFVIISPPVKEDDQGGDTWIERLFPR